MLMLVRVCDIRVSGAVEAASEMTSLLAGHIPNSLASTHLYINLSGVEFLL